MDLSYCRTPLKAWPVDSDEVMQPLTDFTNAVYSDYFKTLHCQIWSHLTTQCLSTRVYEKPHIE